jgi:hypothetical protein
MNVGKRCEILSYNESLRMDSAFEFHLVGWGDPDVEWRIILRWIFRKWEVVVET